MKKLEKDFETRFKDLVRRADPAIQFRKIPAIVGRGFSDRYVQIPEVCTMWMEFKLTTVAAQTMLHIMEGKEGKLVTGLTDLQIKFIQMDNWSKGHAGLCLGVYSEISSNLLLYTVRAAPKAVTYEELRKDGIVVRWNDNWPTLECLSKIAGREHVGTRIEKEH